MDIFPHTAGMNLAGFGCPVNGDLTNYVKSMRHMLHDIAQPLSVMAGTVDLLMIESDPRSRQFDEIKHISDQLQLIIDKMNDLRQLARQINNSVETME
jgi:signal transduction histidine kinase